MTCSGDESEIGGIPRLGCIDSLRHIVYDVHVIWSNSLLSNVCNSVSSLLN